MTCRAIQQSDEMHCATCRLRWDMNDPEPPQCLRQAASPPVQPAPDRYVSALAPCRY